MEHYLYQSQRYRNMVPEPDVTLAQIRQALFGFFGIKDAPEDVDEQIQKLKPLDDKPSELATGLKLTKEETDAWIKAGMPSPPGEWLRAYRHERR